MPGPVDLSGTRKPNSNDVDTFCLDTKPRKPKFVHMSYEELKLQVSATVHRLELAIGASTAFIEYKLSGNNLFLIHTEVPHELEGKGVGGAIVQKALQYAKDSGYKIVPLCPFVQAYLLKHKEWNDLVAPDADRFMNKL
jgi:predicted GNAT family acetyltransferase